MAPEKVTVMILDVDLQCCSCYKKVKKVLCKFPQIREQIFDKDKNKVRITVICCNPEKLRDELCCKGGKVIQRIEIVEDKTNGKDDKTNGKGHKTNGKDDKTNGKGHKTNGKDDKTNGKGHKTNGKDDKTNGKDDKTNSDSMPRVCCQECYEGRDGGPCQYGYCRPICPPRVCCQECYEGRDGGPCQYGHGRQVPPPPPPICRPICPPRVCCQECYEGRDGGPCKYGYGRQVPPPPGPCYDGYGYYGGNRPCYVSRCDYFSEENPQGCSVM